MEGARLMDEANEPQEGPAVSIPQKSQTLSQEFPAASPTDEGWE